MYKPTFGVDAASILFNLPGYRVISASPATDDAPRQVLVETIEAEGACPSCGVLSSRVQERPTQHVKDVSCGGEVIDVRIRKRRYVCCEDDCARKTFRLFVALALPTASPIACIRPANAHRGNYRVSDQHRRGWGLPAGQNRSL